MSYTEHAPKSYVDSKLALKADVVALQAVSAIAAALDTRLSQLARDTYTKTQIDYLTEAIKKGRFKKVDSLPEIEEAELYVIYLVPRSDPTAQNVKDEYIVIVGDGGAMSWEKVGSTDVDLSGYAKTTDVQAVRDSVNSLASDVDALQDDIESDSSRISTLENKVDNPSQVPTEDSNDLISSGGVFAALAGKASTADATLTERGDPSTPGFSAWEITWVNPDYPDPIDGVTWHDGNWFLTVNGQAEVYTGISDRNAVSIDVPAAKAIRTALPGYCLGPDAQTNPNRDKPLASEAEAEALRNGKLDKSGGTFGATTISLTDEGIVVSDTQSSKLTLLSSSYNFLAHRDGLGVRYFAAPSTSGTFALTADIPYALSAKIISNNAVTLDDRASNSVTVSATLSPNTLTINFPTAPTGKLRDFAMRLNIAAGVTAPEIAWPQGVTLENNGGEVPEIADGGTGGSSTILYFSESENNGTTAKFTVKGETLTAIAQA